MAIRRCCSRGYNEHMGPSRCYQEIGLKLITVDQSFAEKHYADLSAKPCLRGLVDYIGSGPVVAMVWEGKSVVTTGRKIISATNPADSAPGTIHGDFGIDIGRV